MRVRESLNPSVLDWRRFLSRSLAVLGAGSLLAGAVCFIAYNWNHMGPLFKLGLTEAAMLALAGLAWRLDRDSLPGQLSLFSAVFLIGPLLAIYGQAYPSGAPLSRLLFIWSALAAVSAFLCGSQGLWLLALSVLNAALYYWNDLGGMLDWLFGKPTRFEGMGLADLAAFGLALVLPNWLPAPSSRRLLLFGAAFFLNIAFVMEQFQQYGHGMSLGIDSTLFLLAMAGTAAYGWNRQDLFAVIIAVLGGFSLANTLLLRAFEAQIWMFLTLINMAAGSIAVAWLSSLYREWRVEA